MEEGRTPADVRDAVPGAGETPLAGGWPFDSLRLSYPWPCCCLQSISRQQLPPNCHPTSTQHMPAGAVRMRSSGPMAHYLLAAAKADPTAPDAQGQSPYTLALALARMDLLPTFLQLAQ